MAQDLSLSQLAQNLALRHQGFREEVAGKVIGLFRLSVVVTGTLTIVLAANDTIMIWLDVIEPDQRLVSERVLMALIGATIIELGAALGTIVLALFRTPKQPAEQDSAD